MPIYRATDACGIEMKAQIGIFCNIDNTTDNKITIIVFLVFNQIVKNTFSNYFMISFDKDKEEDVKLAIRDKIIEMVMKQSYKRDNIRDRMIDE